MICCFYCSLFLCSSWNVGWGGNTNPPLPSLMHSWESHAGCTTPPVRSNWTRFSRHYHSLTLLHWYHSMLHYTSLLHCLYVCYTHTVACPQFMAIWLHLNTLCLTGNDSHEVTNSNYNTIDQWWALTDTVQLLKYRLAHTHSRIQLPCCITFYAIDAP